MPHKFRPTFDMPGWVEALGDECLKTTVGEALWARDFAIRAGAEHGKRSEGLLLSGDRTLHQIQYRRLSTDKACKAATDAVRKFTMAANLAPAKRRYHGLIGSR